MFVLSGQWISHGHARTSSAAAEPDASLSWTPEISPGGQHDLRHGRRCRITPITSHGTAPSPALARDQTSPARNATVAGNQTACTGSSVPASETSTCSAALLSDTPPSASAHAISSSSDSRLERLLRRPEPQAPLTRRSAAVAEGVEAGAPGVRPSGWSTPAVQGAPHTHDATDSGGAASAHGLPGPADRRGGRQMSAHGSGAVAGFLKQQEGEGALVEEPSGAPAAAEARGHGPARTRGGAGEAGSLTAVRVQAEGVDAVPCMLACCPFVFGARRRSHARICASTVQPGCLWYYRNILVATCFFWLALPVGAGRLDGISEGGSVGAASATWAVAPDRGRPCCVRCAPAAPAVHACALHRLLAEPRNRGCRRTYALTTARQLRLRSGQRS